MNTRCEPCKGKGTLPRDGKTIGNHQPFDLVCGSCNGIGHHRLPRMTELAFPED